MSPAGPVVVVGIGSAYRRDDGAGPAVIGMLSGRVPAGTELLVADGEPTWLVEAWTGAAAAIVVDAVTGSGAPAGTLHRIVLCPPEPAVLAPESPTLSWHGAGLGTAIALAEALGRVPPLLIVHGVQAADTGYGDTMTPPVAAALSELAAAVRADLADLAAACQPPGRRPMRR